MTLQSEISIESFPCRVRYPSTKNEQNLSLHVTLRVTLLGLMSMEIRPYIPQVGRERRGGMAGEGGQGGRAEEGGQGREGKGGRECRGGKAEERGQSPLQPLLPHHCPAGILASESPKSLQGATWATRFILVR